jgi:hypothetical protein
MYARKLFLDNDIYSWLGRGRDGLGAAKPRSWYPRPIFPGLFRLHGRPEFGLQGLSQVRECPFGTRPLPFPRPRVGPQ